MLSWVLDLNGKDQVRYFLKLDKGKIVGLSIGSSTPHSNEL